MRYLPSSFVSHVALLAALVGANAVATPVLAQSQGEASIPAQQVPNPTDSDTKGGDAQSRRAQLPSPDAKAKDPYADLNRLLFKGWITPVPTVDDTLSRDDGGWRSSLARAGFGLSLFSVQLGVYDLAQAGSNISGAQLYNGQKFTLQTSNLTGYLTYDLGRIGLSGGQIVTEGVLTTNSYQARNGLRGIRLRAIYWYQPIWHGKVELEAGLLPNTSDYIGTNVGGSLAGGALGPQASIPVETGISYAQYNAPTLSAKINWTKQLYTRTAIQRSISPQGSAVEAASNPTGFAFVSPGGKPLFIQEIGYRIAPTGDTLSTWVRGGFLYNTSRYRLLDRAGTSHNYAFYAAVDHQLTQPDSQQPGRGIYAGATTDFAPASVDTISRYFEARLYSKGPFASRPHDLVSLVAAVNVYGADARRAQALPGFEPSGTTQTYTASYSFQVTHGLYVQPGISTVVHPVFNRDIGTAVNGLLNLVTFF